MRRWKKSKTAPLSILFKLILSYFVRNSKRFVRVISLKTLCTRVNPGAVSKNYLTIWIMFEHDYCLVVNIFVFGLRTIITSLFVCECLCSGDIFVRYVQLRCFKYAIVQ